jgi:hypothetical protein
LTERRNQNKLRRTMSNTLALATQLYDAALTAKKKKWVKTRGTQNHQEKTLREFGDHIADGMPQTDFITEYNRKYQSQPEIPQLTTALLRQWIYLDPVPEVRERRTKAFEQAKRDYAHSLVSEMIEIADEVQTPAEAVVAQLRIKTRQWVASKHNASAYGDKLETVHSLKPGSAPLAEINIMTVPSGTYIEVNGETIENEANPSQIEANPSQIEANPSQIEAKLPEIVPNPREVARLAREKYDGSELLEEQQA